MSLPAMTKVDSSHLAEIGASGMDLYVRFKGGGLFRYPGAGHLADAAIKADSVGKFFHANVKGVYHHVVVDA